MAEGNLRVDVNVSVRRANTSVLGTRCELKNLNSLKALKQAIEFEAKRQVDVIEGGDRVIQETRFYDPESKGTVSGRKKEDELDYRYFPEPDLPPLTVDAVRCSTSSMVFAALKPKVAGLRG
jgi:aspartyl-tRNA(Asn)/glutamyl-tRNA(Gln) amidotransferase subunit B